MILSGLCLAPQMIGKKYGRVLVLGISGRTHRYSVSPGRTTGQCHVLVAVRCECGAEYNVPGHALRNGHHTQCRDCRFAEQAQRMRDTESIVLPSGATLAQISHRTGILLNTLYVRWRRGWPEERLAEPLMKRRAK